MPDTPKDFSLPDAAAAVSAALRGPLTDLFAHIGLLISRADPADEPLRRELEAILLDAYRLLRATGAITTTAAYATQEAALVPVAIWEELSQCFHSASILLSHSGCRLEYEFPATAEYVSAELPALSTALLHILCNALEASPTGSVVTVRGSVLHDKAVVTFTDHGHGIPPEQLDHVFEPFYSSSPQGLPYQSLGLGLSLARAVITQHGGTVQVLSRGDGTTVVCTLPLLEEPGELPLHSGRPLYLEDRYSPAYVVLCGFVPPPWPY